MSPRLKSFLLWFFAFIFTAAIAVYQRKTGPTYEIRDKVVIDNQTIPYKLIRTYDGADDAAIFLEVPDRDIKGEIRLRRFLSYDDWTVKPMKRAGPYLVAFIPHEPPAGKVMYTITLQKNDQLFPLTKDNVVMRYKGFVPRGVLILHIITIFAAMLFSTRTGLEVLFKGKYTFPYTWVTIITLLIGGLILGPIVQKYSFGVYWSGWPFGHDLTDNKSLVAFIFWVAALWVQVKNRERKTWSVVAAVIMLVVFLIPHSMLGSEIDFTKAPKSEMQK
jgi:hypothetical protein